MVIAVAERQRELFEDLTPLEPPPYPVWPKPHQTEHLDGGVARSLPGRPRRTPPLYHQTPADAVQGRRRRGTVRPDRPATRLPSC